MSEIRPVSQFDSSCALPFVISNSVVMHCARGQADCLNISQNVLTLEIILSLQQFLSLYKNCVIILKFM
jgi:hypothetical protein